jgi:WD40 repeat protein
MVTGEERRRELEVGGGGDAAFLPDGSLFAIASSAGWVRLFETATWNERLTLSGFLHGVHSVAFSPDGRRLVSGGGFSEAVRLWDIENGQPLFTLEPGATILEETAFSPDGNVLGSRSATGVLYIWRAPSWREIQLATASEQARGQGPRER